MQLNRELILLSVFVVCVTAKCSSKFNEFNFLTKEQPDAVIDIDVDCVKIVGLTQNSLDRFTNLKNDFKISYFTIDNSNTLNQPHLFAHHATLNQLSWFRYNGLEELAVHEDLFSGLANLEDLTLSGLNLETIPKKLFNNLFKLQKLNLSNNKLKSLDSDVFSTNPKLSFIMLGENQLLQSGIPLELTLLHHRTSVLFSGSYVNDFNTLVPILSHPNVTYTNLALSNLTNIKFIDFAQFPERQTRMDMRTHDSEMAFYLDDLKLNGIEYELVPYKNVENVINNSRALIDTDVRTDSPMCNDCRFIRDSFRSYLEDINDFNIHLINSKVVFTIFLACEDMENHYTNEFKTNCPDECICQYNPLLDKVWIDCHGKNLTSVPTIPYPSQYEQIKSFAIDLSDNLLESFVLGNIEGRVAELITELNLNDNQLKTINLGESVSSNIHQINLCRNPIWNEKPDGLIVFVDSIFHNLKIQECTVGHPFPSKPLQYISQKSKVALELILTNEICH